MFCVKHTSILAVAAAVEAAAYNIVVPQQNFVKYITKELLIQIDVNLNNYFLFIIIKL